MASDDVSLDGIKREVSAAIDRAYALGRSHGEAAAMERIKQVILTPSSMVVSTSVDRVRPPEQTGGRMEYGRVKGSLRRTLLANPDGAAAPKVHAYCRDVLGVPVELGQVRNGLKILRRGGEAELRDGKWFPGPKLDRGMLGASPPSLFRPA